MREVNSLRHTRRECKYHVSPIYPEVSAKDIVQSDTPGVGRGVSSVGRTEGESDRRRASDAGSCAHDVVGAVEVCRVAGGGAHQGEECDIVECTPVLKVGQ